MSNKDNFQKFIVDKLMDNPHGRLLLAPRSGKTKIIIDYIIKADVKSVLWVTPSQQLAATDIPDEFKKWGADNYINRLTTITWKSLNKTGGYFELIVFDEEQFITANNTENLFNNILRYENIISMTGTPSNIAVKHQLYERLQLPIIYTLTIDDAVNFGLLSDYVINVINVPLGDEKNIQAGSKKRPFMTSEKKHYDYLCKKVENPNNTYADYSIRNRMLFIKNSISKTQMALRIINNTKGRKLIFAGSVKQAEQISNQTYHSKTTNKWLNKFINNEIDTLVLVNSGGVGFTYKNINHLVIVQSDSNNNGLTSQKITRTLLSQTDYMAVIWILQLSETVDVKWVTKTLRSFDENKIRYYKL